MARTYTDPDIYMRKYRRPLRQVRFLVDSHEV
jgi:hypothetical protein